MNIDLIKRELKTHFIGKFNIPDVLSYIDEIDSFKVLKYKNLILKIYYKSTDNLDFNFIKRVLRRGAYILKKKQIIIHLIPSPAKKLLKTDGIMTSENINSGFTYIKRNEIYIFRREEFPKVILHELIHHDHNIHHDEFKKENEILLRNHFKLTDETTLILNEAMIELWASLYQLAFVSIDYKIEFKKLYEMEMKYNLYKCHQILNIQKDNYWDDRCNIYSYIIFKTILFLNLNEFIKKYRYPHKYDDSILTQFLIKHSKLSCDGENPEYLNKKRPDNSLCFMLFSDF
jgi:hypothetical protein